MTTIGVSGHRFLADIDRITAGVDRALFCISSSFDGPYTVVSALAEGADRLVVRRALACWPEMVLIALLPLEQEQYVETFRTLASRRVFKALVARADEVITAPESRRKPDAFKQAGRALLDLSDVLIAVWDGSVALGAGGTGEIVAAARSQGLPLAWIQAGNRLPGTEQPTSLGEAQGSLTLERIPERSGD